MAEKFSSSTEPNHDDGKAGKIPAFQADGLIEQTQKSGGILIIGGIARPMRLDVDAKRNTKNKPAEGGNQSSL